jgi:phosphate transport system substrate-binding protein
MSIIKSTILLLALAVLFGCKPRNAAISTDKLQADFKNNISGNFSISGAYALYPIVRKWADDFMMIHQDVKIEVIKAGTGRGIDELIAGESQLAMISRHLYDDELNSGLWYVTVAKDGVVPIVNQDNPYFERILSQGLSPDEYLKAFTSESPVTWGELFDTDGKEKVMVFSRADESGAADVFAAFLFKNPSDLKGTKVTGDEEMIKSIQENIYGMGFCNFSYAFDIATGERTKDIQIIPADLDFDNNIDRKEVPFSNLEAARRGIWLGIYPKNLCRELTLSSLGRPSDPAIIEFLRYVLNEGQSSIEKTGLCELNDFSIKYSLDKLK